MTSGNAITPAKKRAGGGAKKDSFSNDGGNGSPKPTKKRVRKTKKAETSEPTVPTEDDEEELESPKAKKVKVENQEDLIGDEAADEAEAGFAGV